MQLFTVQLAKWRLLREKGIFLLDATVKSGNGVFAPSWEIVSAYKRGFMSPEEYTHHYRNKMEHSKIAFPWDWKVLEVHERLAIGCYCPADHFCHRHILTNVFSEFLMSRGMDVQLGGEIYS